jgi:hypothetical protein
MTQLHRLAGSKPAPGESPLKHPVEIAGTKFGPGYFDRELFRTGIIAFA